ncbi:MAG: galactose-1-phosphate uridylyltransferase [Candidatus Omnitrophica bacterium]|nr:galactose-1-phosphate uridylyltransferase [Candidatus Omnitrophota bacterium]
MPQLRRDLITGRWVIIAVERSKRPEDFSKSDDRMFDEDCPFCAGQEDRTQPEIYSLRKSGTLPNTPGWEVRVVPNIVPIMRVEGEYNRRGYGVYDVMDNIGAHEVIAETPEHIAHISDLEVLQIKKVIDTYIYRINDLEKDHRFKYVLIYKNFGEAAGSRRFKHSRSHIIATPVIPAMVKEKLGCSQFYYLYRDRCVFCDILKQEISAGERVVAEIDGFVAVAPFASRFPFETWILPKHHSPDFTSLSDGHREKLAEILKVTLGKIKRALNSPPYNLVIHTAPFRKDAGPNRWKTIEHDYHWHIEIIPRLTLMAGFEWGSDVYINPTAPEQAAKFLRETNLEWQTCAAIR